ncbi:MAG: hypothetical protein U1F68_08185 [Gammaproteobacteria bacterium]
MPNASNLARAWRSATRAPAYLPGTSELRLSLSTKPNLNVPHLLERLDRYPYGCLEQTTSRALPLIYFDKVTESWGGAKSADDANLHARVQNAIQRVFSMQHFEGGFGLWNSDSPMEQWLSAYAMDFLSRAKDEAYLVPENPYQRGLGWLQSSLNTISYERADLAARAYTLYVLARANQAPLGDLRYLHDNYLDKLPTRLARAQLGAALARQGDRGRAQEAFELALEELDHPDDLHDYGTVLRDRAALVALLSESGMMADKIPQLAEQMAVTLDSQAYTSTQEESWMLLAAHALLKQRGALKFAVDGQAVAAKSDPYYLKPTLDQLARVLRIANQGEQPLWYVANASGVPSAPLPAAENGFSITRRYYTRDGDEVDPTKVGQNEMLVAVISGNALTSENHQALIVDLLPAGFELENARLGGEAKDDYEWLPALSTALHTEMRDDRFVAALDLPSGQREFAVAYLVRAVTPGDYVLPAVYVEDMYKPWFHGRGAMAKATVQ